MVTGVLMLMHHVGTFGKAITAVSASLAICLASFSLAPSAGASERANAPAEFHAEISQASQAAPAGPQVSAKSESQTRSISSKRINGFDLFDGNYVDVFESCGDAERGSLGSRNGIKLWTSVYDLCAFGVEIALPRGTNEWRLTFEGIDECFDELWLFAVADDDFGLIEEGKSIRFPSNDCGPAREMTTNWSSKIFGGSAYILIFTDAFISPLNIDSVLLEYKTDSEPAPEPTRPSTITITCSTGNVDGKPGAICLGETKRIAEDSRLQPFVRINGKGKWAKLAKKFQPAVTSDGTFSWAWSNKRAKSFEVYFTFEDVESNRSSAPA